MSTALDLGGAFALASFSVALLCTRAWLKDTAFLARRELLALGISPGARCRLGVSWLAVAARHRRNAAWVLACAGSWAVAAAALHFTVR